MPKRKRLTTSLSAIEKAKLLVKKKPLEFWIGLFILLLMLFLTSYLFISWTVNPFSLKKKVKITEISPTPVAEKFYILNEGESLWDVAQREYGNPLLYPTLVELNKLNSPDLTEPGMRIRVK